ncbi:MAG TPA: TIM-barrel domain-containing protein [Woeseiaceae bacterium]|nr:TIM-barrel domain-containing protein [Woeseiaceae bacterium]
MTFLKDARLFVFAPLLLLLWSSAPAGTIMSGGKPAQLNIRLAGTASLRVTLKPLDYAREFPDSPAIARGRWPEPVIELEELDGILNRRIGPLYVTVSDNPLTIDVSAADGRSVQNVVFAENGAVSFRLDDRPVLGLGGGGPAMGENWREEPLEFDRRGRLHEMTPRWQQKAYGSRNPVPLIIGTSGWALFMNSPWVQVDLRDERRGLFVPWEPREAGSAAPAELQGRPSPESEVEGLLDFFLFDAGEPATFMADIVRIAGRPVMPPKWAFGYMQSHRLLEDEQQMIDIVNTFRRKNLPIDAVIYQGTGHTPRGWNTEQPSFTFNPEVFTREPPEVIGDLHERNVKVIVHVVPPSAEDLPRLHGNVPPRENETVDESHIQAHWEDHVPLLEAGIDAFWPDEGDRFDLPSRLNRHKMYYQGPLSVQPNRRPWSLHRNGYLGIGRWGGWMWSGDTDSSWQTLAAQIMVGLNHSLSISPYWGSDIGGFYPNEELTAELYARWFQFAAFTPSFRGHGRTWWTRLPWGWGLSEMGPEEHRTNPLPSELNNRAIEGIARKYAELRYRLLPYNYALAWQARDLGLPMMRPLWLHYPQDEKSTGIGTEYLWGRDFLIAPVTEKGTKARDVYLPEGDWYDWWTGDKHSGGGRLTRVVDLETMPIYVRAGAIIPLDPVREYIGQEVSEPMELRVFRGSDGEFTLYDDDGTTLNYLEGQGSLTRVTWNDDAATLTIAPAPKDSARERSESRQFRIELLPDGASRLVTYLGRRVTVAF